MPPTAAKRRAKRSFGRIERLPSKRYRARYVGPDGALYRAPDTFVARIDAEGWLANVERQISRGDWQAPSVYENRPSTFGPYAELDLAARSLTPRTRELYERQLARLILPTFGHVSLDKITPALVRSWFAAMPAHQQTQRAHAYSLLRSILGRAVEEGLLTSNPCRIRSATSRRRARRIEPATVEQLKLVEDELDLRYGLPVLLAAWCGLRSGEVRALRVREVDIVDGWVHVRHGVTRVSGEVLIGAPKTPASVRDVAIPPHLLPSLKRWRNELPKKTQQAFFFPGRDGAKPMSEKALRYGFTQAKKLMGRADLTFHDLRHTAATLAAQNGATTAELMRRLGHTTAAMAMRYQHGTAQRDQTLAAGLSALALAAGPTTPGQA